MFSVFEIFKRWPAKSPVHGSASTTLNFRGGATNHLQNCYFIFLGLSWIFYLYIVIWSKWPFGKSALLLHNVLHHLREWKLVGHDLNNFLWSPRRRGNVIREIVNSNKEWGTEKKNSKLKGSLPENRISLILSGCITIKSVYMYNLYLF